MACLMAYKNVGRYYLICLERIPEFVESIGDQMHASLHMAKKFASIKIGSHAHAFDIPLDIIEKIVPACCSISLPFLHRSSVSKIDARFTLAPASLQSVCGNLISALRIVAGIALVHHHYFTTSTVLLHFP